MSPKFTQEQQKAIMIHVAQMEANGKSKKEIYQYLKEQGYTNPTDKFNGIRESGDYTVYLDKAKLIKEKLAKTGCVETEEVKVERNGVEYEKQPAMAAVINVPQEEAKLDNAPETIDDNCVVQEAYDPQVPMFNKEVTLEGKCGKYSLNNKTGKLTILFGDRSCFYTMGSMTEAKAFIYEFVEALKIFDHE